MPEKTTHYLCPRPLVVEFRNLAARRMQQQSVLLRSGVGSMLSRWKDSERLPVWPEMPAGELVSVVFRLPEHTLYELKALAKRTAVHQSVWLRLAHHDMLMKMREQAELDAEAAA